MREEEGVQRHNVSRGCNSVQLLFKIYYSLRAAFPSLSGGLTVTIAPLLQPGLYECDDNAKVTSDLLVLRRSLPVKRICGGNPGPNDPPSPPPAQPGTLENSIRTIAQLWLRRCWGGGGRCRGLECYVKSCQIRSSRHA